MSTKKKRAGKSGPKKRELPPALAKRARALATNKVARLRRRARDLLAGIARRKAVIAESFYDIGAALVELKSKEMLAALGRRSFAELCEKDCHFDVAVGKELVTIAESMTREEAIAAGSQTRAAALAGLARATPALDTAGGLGRKKRALLLPDGTTLDTRHASGKAIERAAAKVRHATQASGSAKDKKPRGRTTTPDERALAARLQAQLHTHGFHAATVTAVATKPGQGADLRIEHVQCAKADSLSRALDLGKR